MSAPTIVLSDDGTLDTVLVCTVCREEMRYNFAPDTDDETYEDFVAWAIEDASAEHECGEPR